MRLIPTHAGSTSFHRPITKPSKAHPHSRGEHYQAGGAYAQEAGSSPLTRGAPAAAHAARAASGLIPTHAGSTLVGIHERDAAPAHPHSRGEHGSSMRDELRQGGSSPLTRGALLPARRPRHESRLIPTHAGSTTGNESRGANFRAHPHSRGEHSWEIGSKPMDIGSSPLTRGAPNASGKTRISRGSSPLTRGARRVEIIEGNLTRLIPTHAGSTPVAGGGSYSGSAHPHSRGEHVWNTFSSTVSIGSSPLTRGALSDSRDLVTMPGLIPTHAGSTSRPSMLSVAMRGSSPLTRGARPAMRVRRAPPWLIPTHAGSTAAILRWFVGPRAHPHSRGEHQTETATLTCENGSSPLTRGAPHPHHRNHRRRLAHPHSRGEHMRSPSSVGAGSGSSPLTRGAPSRVTRSSSSRRLIPTHAGSTFSASLGVRGMGAHPHSRGEHAAEETQTEPVSGSSPLTRGAHLMICDFRAFVDPFLGILAAPVVVSRSCSYRDDGVPHPDLTAVPARSHRHIHPDGP